MTAIFTGALALFAVMQWRAMRDGLASTRQAADAATSAAATAKRALEVAERADILVKAVTISTYPDFSRESVISIVFKNFGRTRGNRVVVNAGLVFVPEIEEIPAEQPIIATAVGAGDTLLAIFRPMRDGLTGETFGKIKRGDLALRFDAEVVYFDVFDNRHRTKCGGIFIPETCSFRVDANQEAD